MTWRAAYLRARLVPLVGSLLLVLVANGLAPGAVLGWLGGSVILGVMAMRTRWWRPWTRARTPTEAELGVIRAAVALVPGLRGRHEPTAWVVADPGVWVEVRGPHDVVVSTGWLRWGGRDGVTWEHLGASVAAARGRAATRTTGTAVVDVLCVPGRLAWAPVRWLQRRIPGLGWWMRGWSAVLAVIAVVQMASVGRWSVVASLVAAIMAAVGASWWSARWRRTLDRLGVEATDAAGLAGS